MAATFQGIKVEVISNDQTLRMYDDPDATVDDDPQKRQYYIEAVTGATFELRISLTPEYEQTPCDAVRISLDFDDHAMGWYRDITFSRKRSVIFNTISEFCHKTNQWKSGKLSFAKLDIKETSDTKIDLAQSSKLGRIRLEIGRVTHIGEHYKSDIGHNLKRVAEVSEKILKGKAIANTIGLVDFKPGSEPPNGIHCRPIRGSLGQPIFIDILYRSKDTLKMIGCIPRTPSPDAELKTDDLATTLDPEEELQALRARISQLERMTSIKGERSHTPVSVKRERESNARTSSHRKRSRASESPEVIEATGSRRKPARIEEIDLTSD